jgi:uncharacterized protein DUF4105
MAVRSALGTGRISFRGLNDATPSLTQRTNRLGRSLLTGAALMLGVAGASGSLVLAGAQSVSRTTPGPTTLRFTRDSLRIYLLTIGSGTEIWNLFGHNAIWVHDPTKGIDDVFNWGVFSFDHPVTFVLQFLKGDMRYSMNGDPFDATVAYYRHDNRQMWAQELNLTAAEKTSLVAFLHWNVRPENATYRYDYYRDNCSTRVRDAIDRVVGGAVRPQLKAIATSETYRGHSLRLMQGMQPVASGVELALGRPTDVPLTADETAFLPVQLMRHLRSVTLDRGTRKLIGEEFVINEAVRTPEPTTIPRLWKGFVPIGLGVGTLIIWLCVAGGASRGRRRALAIVVALMAGLIGVLGLVITYLVTFSDHVAAHANENITMFNPLWLAVAALAPMLILRQRSRVAATRLTLGSAMIALVAVLMHLVGLSRQPNWDVIGLALPVELAIAWVVVDASRPS